MFSERKAAQVAAYFLRQSPGRSMAHLKLMKLLYLADREAIRVSSWPILGDRLMSMPHGPVLSQTLDLMDGNVESQPSGWEHWISDKQDHEVSLRHSQESAPLDELSPAELDVLKTVWSQFGGMGKWQIRDWTHEHCPEWQDPTCSSLPISYETLARAVGFDESSAAELAARIQAEQEIDRLFASM